MEIEPMSMDLRLAAIISLLTSSTVKGLSNGRVGAICAHLQAAVQSAEMFDVHLRKTLENVLAEMQMLECQCRCATGAEFIDCSPCSILH